MRRPTASSTIPSSRGIGNGPAKRNSQRAAPAEAFPSARALPSPGPKLRNRSVSRALRIATAAERLEMRLHRMAAGGLLVGAIFAASGCDGFKANPNFAQNAAQSANAAQPTNLAQSATVASAPVATSNTAAAAASAATTTGPGQLQSASGEPDSGSAPANLAAAQGSAAPEAIAIDAASFTARPTATAKRRLLIRAQVILDRAHFSPGVIDGRNGTNSRRALSAFEAANDVAPAPSGLATLDEPGWQAL